MPRDFLPRTDAGLLSFTSNLSTKITATPTAYGLTAPIATEYAAAQSAFAAALTAATDPATRGKSTVFAKNEAANALVALTRAVARQIQGTMSVTDQQRVDLGLPVRDVEPTPVPVPTAAISILFENVNGRTVDARVIDPENPTRRSKPPGVALVTLLSYVGATPPADPADWKFEGASSRTRFNVVFPLSVAAGSKVWMCAFWSNAKGQSGYACEPQSTYLGMAGDMPIAA